MSVHAVGSFALDRNGGSLGKKGPGLLSEFVKAVHEPRKRS